MAEKIKYSNETEQAKYIDHLIKQFNNRPDVGSSFFETETESAIRSKNPIKMDMIADLAGRYEYRV